MHAVVERSTCPSQNVQNTPAQAHVEAKMSIAPDALATFSRPDDGSMSKSARHFGAKNISKSKVLQTESFK